VGSVSFDLYEQAGELLVAEDVGHPNAKLYQVGDTSSPRFRDHRSTLTTFTCVGQLIGPSAYEDAKFLADELVKPYSNDTPLELDLSDVSLYADRAPFTVAPLTASALKLHYPPTQKDWVSLEVSMPVVDEYIASDFGEIAEPTAEADPGAQKQVTIRDAEGPLAVSIDHNVDVVREVGRPNSGLRPTTSKHPRFVDRRRAASDTFEIQGVLDGPESTPESQELSELFGKIRGEEEMVLSFDGGLYELGAYPVFPEGSRAIRLATDAGEINETAVQSLALRVVSNDP
jgi:hypothetical protein